MANIRFPVTCPTCGYQASGRLRAEEYGPQYDTFVRLGAEDLKRECPDHTATAWAFMQTPEWKRVEDLIDPA
jgi:hypothetical protein